MTAATASWSRLPGTRQVAERMVNADERFLENVTARGFTLDEARRIFGYYRKHRIIKLDAVGGVWAVKHGAFWETDVLGRALEESSKIPAKRRR